MLRSVRLKLLFLLLICLPFSPARGQDQPPSADASRQVKSDQSSKAQKPPEFITSNTPSVVESCKSLKQETPADKQDPALRAFLHSVAGRWNFAYVRRGNQSWWPNHDSARPKNEIHYLFGPEALLFEFRPEFALPSITGCFLYGSGHKVSAELFDLELRKPSDFDNHEDRPIQALTGPQDTGYGP